MIKHIVMVRLKEHESERLKLQNAKKLKSLLEGLEEKINEIINISLINQNKKHYYLHNNIAIENYY